MLKMFLKLVCSEILVVLVLFIIVVRCDLVLLKLFICMSVLFKIFWVVYFDVLLFIILVFRFVIVFFRLGMIILVYILVVVWCFRIELLDVLGVVDRFIGILLKICISLK